jgi:glucose dehydrogenase
MNHGKCNVCPIGARYSPNHHLALAVKTGLCRLQPNTSVRRLLFDTSGRARALVYRSNDGSTDREHAAKVVIVAAGAIESARLLLMSSGHPRPDGLREDGHVGRHLLFHHLWWNRLHYREQFLPGNIGAATGRCHQFLDPPTRGRHGGIKVEFSSDEYFFPEDSLAQSTGPQVLETLNRGRHYRVLNLHAESAPSEEKFVRLSTKRDRFGDPFAHVQYRSNAFDCETYQFGTQIVEQFASATGAYDTERAAFDEYDNAAHHMGTCRMGQDARDSVVDSFGRVHGSPNLFVVGGSNFAGSTALQPTLTMVALAFRTSRYVAKRLL